MESFWPGWVAFWVPWIASLVALIWAIPRNAPVDFLEAKQVERVAVRGAMLAYRSITAVFGEKIISVRSFVASMGLSIGWFLVAFCIAASTTPYLWHDAIRVFVLADPLPSELGNYQTASLVAGFVIVVASFIAEFGYIAKSRLIIRRLRMDSSYATLLTLVLADVASTFALFVLITPIVVMAALYALYLLFDGVDLRYVQVIQGGAGELVGGQQPPTILMPNLWHPITAYSQLVELMLRSGWEHFRSFFYLYEWFHFWPITFIQGVDEVRAARHIKWPLVLASGFSLPFTTMLATAFATSVWLAFTASLLIFCRFLCRTFVTARRIFRHVHNHPGTLFWFGVLPSLLIFLLGAAIRLVTDFTH